MEKLKIEYKKLKDLKPYEKNARKHTDSDIEYIINSIRDFGMNDPIGIWGEDNLIVEGHGRVLACKKLGIKDVPTIRLDHLTDEQRRAYTLAHNKTAEMSDWDFDILNLEVGDIFDLDMEDYGFELFDEQEENLKNSAATMERASDIENLGKGWFKGTGYYGIPEIKPVYELPPIDEWIGFNYAKSCTDPERKAVHFFVDDYQFERVWNNPERYVDILKEFACIASPDFSPYGDMPMALQIYNHYRKHWVAAYMQEHGVTVIPTVRASSDPRSLDWYLDGEPKGGIVMISSMWTRNEKELNYFKQEYNKMFENLNPSKVFMYGKLVEGLQGNIERVSTFSDKRFSNDG